jgi:hypothetical protein
MKKISETNNVCEFCNRSFSREKSLLTHACEKKRRWLERDVRGNQIGFQSFVQFYNKHTASKKIKTYEDFIHSPYYLAFVKFGNYCLNVNVINVSRYVEWLLKDGIKLNDWATDSNYTKFLTEYLRQEDPFDALARSVKTCKELSEMEDIQISDVLRYANINRICHAVTNGKISPWMLYQSNSGTQFLNQLNQDHVKIIIDYINPEMWALKFKREPELTKTVKETLAQAGY